MPVSWRMVGNLWYTDWNGYYIASPMILKIMRKQEKHVMFEIRKCGVQNLANTLSIVIDNNIHVLHNNKDEKISFPEELTSELVLGSSPYTQAQAPSPSSNTAQTVGESVTVTEIRMAPSTRDQPWASTGKGQGYPRTHTWAQHTWPQVIPRCGQVGWSVWLP